MSARPSVGPTRSRHRNGFTLIELLVVIAIIAALASVVAPAIFRNVGDARSTAARAQLNVFELALVQYRTDNGFYPTSEQGLEALRTAPGVSGESGEAVVGWRGPYLTRPVPLDPWGRPYIYQSPGVHDTAGYDLSSLGRDRKEGGAGEDADVNSWDAPNSASAAHTPSPAGRD